MGTASESGEGTMRAAYLAAPGEIAVADFPVREPAEGEVLVRMSYASICGSDVHNVFDGFHGPDAIGRPGFPGHEGVGIVARSRSEAFAAGDRVLTVPHSGVGGCFAEYLVVPGAFLVGVPETLGDETAMLAQQLGTAIYALKRFVFEEPREVAVVIGAGSAGLLFAQLLRLQGFSTVIVSDPEAGRRAHAARLGADAVEPGALAAAVADATSGHGADAIIEAAGSDACRREAIELVRPRGTVGFFGFPEPPGTMVFPTFECFIKSVRVEFISNTQGEPGLVSFATAIEMLADGRIDPAGIYGTRYTLDAAAEALAEARRATGPGKVLFDLRAAS